MAIKKTAAKGQGDVSALKVGATALHVERILSSERVIRTVMIIRETPTQWIDDIGTRWRKSDGAKVPQYAPGPRYLVSAQDCAVQKAGGS